MKFVVIGDLMVDKTIHGEVTKISPEAPVPVVNIKYETNVLGGSGNVVKNLTSMGHEVVVSGFAGNLSKKLMSEDKLINHSFCTYTEKDNVKLRYVDIKTGYHLLRVDDEDETKSYGPLTWGAWGPDLDAIKPDGIILSDYGKNAIDGNVKGIVESAKQRKIPIFVDTRRGDVRVFEGVNWMMPNAQELEAIKETLGVTEEHRIIELLDLDGLIVTKSENGMTFVGEDGSTLSIPITSSDVVDVTGAGDTAIAAFAVGICTHQDPIEAMKFSNYCAGVVCRQRGTSTVTKEDVDTYHAIEHGIYT